MSVAANPFPHIESRFVEVGGLRIHCRMSEGDGPAVVLLPGGILDSSLLTWRFVLEALPAHFRVFVPDLPGYGRSDKPDAPYTTDYFIDFVGEFLDALGLDRVSLFGSSMSGATAIGYALRWPGRVERLGLAGAYGFQPRLPLHELAYAVVRLPGIAGLIRTVLRLHPMIVGAALPVSVHDVRRITHTLIMDSYAALRHERAMEAFITWMRSELLPHRVRSDFTSRLYELAMPVLILHGAYDWTMPPMYARHAARLIPRAKLHLFPDAGHLVPRERPDAVNRLIFDFLQTRVTD